MKQVPDPTGRRTTTDRETSPTHRIAPLLGLIKGRQRCGGADQERHHEQPGSPYVPLIAAPARFPLFSEWTLLMKLSAFIPYDPIDKKSFVNATADSAQEAEVNLSLIDLPDEVAARIVYLPATVSFDAPKADAPEKVTEHHIGTAISGLMRAFDAEYAQMTKDDLEQKWFFEFDPAKSLEANMYHFHDMLTLYAGSCRRWEEKHNGSSCVVERVRDTYIMPKIREFAEQIRASYGISKSI